MPTVIAEQLRQWGHNVDILEPGKTITSLFDLPTQHYDAYVLKTVSDGPGLSILEAAEAIGLPTINNSRAIHMVRDKAIATAYAHAHGIPTPLTYFVAQTQLLEQVPEKDYPLVIKPANGSSGRGVNLVHSPTELKALQAVTRPAKGNFWLAQHYINNTGFDIKVYVTGKEVYSVAKRSPLHPEIDVDKQLIPITLELRNLALRVGAIFGLDIYGLDVIQTEEGLMVVDINDFPSFGLVPHAITRVSKHIIAIAKRSYAQRQPTALAAASNSSNLTPLPMITQEEKKPLS
ncbi:ATP-grasp domain-containing protein [Ktedonosporobacter rubrisoli]|nr:ATP-grasp domain-containing protein [Ktedonosporobacter rubrisoli]